MELSNINFVIPMLTRGGGVNSYKITLYKELNINKDCEISSYDTRIFS